MTGVLICHYKSVPKNFFFFFSLFMILNNALLRTNHGDKTFNPFCSPDLPENEATFAVTTGGIADAKE